MRLKELRKAKKLRQSDVAKVINCSQAVYSRYENGEREPSAETLKALADFHNVTVDYLLGREDKPALHAMPTIAADGTQTQEAGLDITDLKNHIVLGKVIPAGTGMLRYKTDSALVVDVSGSMEHGEPETEAIAAKVFAIALNYGLTKEEIMEFVGYFGQLTPSERKNIISNMKFLHSQRNEEEGT